ncbi:Serine phosphatase RsbU, regulator of sigma subunit [Olavius sp. associated proteobacterium Delta 1]|nr:Serine phosphatase RsbU, regulator of sigma subunit [Olavius sp. associated proteobacterium Delta 1]
MSPKDRFSFAISRLTRRIVFWVFISVILIETLIFIPSYKQREKELLEQMKDISAARVVFAMRIVAPDASHDELFAHIKQLHDGEVVVGGALYTSEGKKIGSFGEMPELSISSVNPASMTFLLNQDGSRYDIACSPVELQRDYRLILRHDASSVQQELLSYFLRIAGLVLIISLVVTVGTWLPLRWIVVNPVLNLRNDLIRAGEVLSQDQQTPEFYSANIQRDDELGEVIGAFRRMYRQISDAINKRKKAEEALQQSFQQVEAYSRVLNDELEKGRQMQINFLPDQLLQLPGWETAAFFKPARQVAGDFYDLFQLPEDSVGFVVADVCDKGVGAALFMALFRSLIRIFSGQTSLNGLPLTSSDAILDESEQLKENPTIDPNHFKALKAVQLTNKYIALNHGELAMFATLFFGILDPDTGKLSYINGGHEPLYIVNSGGGVKAQLTTSGPAVGIEPALSFKIQQTQMEPGDILLGYTDGVTEASAADGSFFAVEQLMSILDAPSSSASEMLDRIADSLQEHIGEAEQFDDITLLAIRRIS